LSQTEISVIIIKKSRRVYEMKKRIKLKRKKEKKKRERNGKEGHIT